MNPQALWLRGQCGRVFGTMPRKNHVQIQNNVSGLGLCSALTVFTSHAMAQQKTANNTLPEDESVKRVLQTKAEDRGTRYIVALRDLNGDGIPEAIAYLIGNDWCGSGGCNLFILQKSGDSWKIISSVTITYPPVWIFKGTSNGWHNLGVQGGGGSVRAHDVELRFNGAKYRKSPSVSLAGRAGKDNGGELVIPSFESAKPLF